MKLKIISAVVVFMTMIQLATAQKQCCPQPSTKKPNAILVGTGSFASADIVINTDPANTSVSVTASDIDLKVLVENIMNDDCSHDTKVIVLLPPNTEIKGYSAVTEFGAPLKMMQCYGFLLVDAGMVCPKANSTAVPPEFQKFTITVKIGHPHSEVKACFGVMVYGSTPDPKPENNYWSWKE